MKTKILTAILFAGLGVIVAAQDPSAGRGEREGGTRGEYQGQSSEDC